MRYLVGILLNRLFVVLVVGGVCLPAFPSLAEEKPNAQLFSIQVDGTGLEQLTHKLDWRFGAAQWSPDGSQIAVDGWMVEEFKKQSYSATHLFVMNADGSESVDIGLGAMPSWSPDGKQLVCHTYKPSSSLVVMNVDGTGREEVANHWGSPRWFPTGNRIVSLSQGGIASLDLATGIESSLQIPRTYSPKLGFSCSPDGRQICFADRNAGGLAIAFLDKSGKCLSVRSHVAGLECSFSSWSPDNKQVVFGAKAHEGAKSQIYMLTIASGDPPARLPGQPENVDNFDPDWSPDGIRILFSSDVPE